MSKSEETNLHSLRTMDPTDYQVSMQALDRQLKENFTLLYMIKPGNYLQSKLRMQALYRDGFVSALFHEESIKALYAIRGIQFISFTVGWYLVTRTYLNSLTYRYHEHRIVKVETFVVQTDYQRQPTAIDFSLASCSWKTNLLFVIDVAHGVSYILASIFGFFEKTKTPKAVICLGGLIAGIGHMILFLGNDENFVKPASYHCLVSSLVSFLVFPCPTVFKESLTLELMLSSLVILSISLGAGGTFAVELLTAIGLFSAILVTKYAIMIAVRIEAKKDTNAFDEAWRSITQSSFVQADLGTTEQILQNFMLSCPGLNSQDAIHTFVMPDRPTSDMIATDSSHLKVSGSYRSSAFSMESSFSLSNSSFFAGSMPTFPVADLDQLYVRSVLVLPMFFRKLIAIGGVSKGYCCCMDERDGSKQYILYKELGQSPDMFASIYDASLKRVDRAVEKVLIHLQGEVCRITDVVRQNMLFDNLHDLNVALKHWLEDPEVRVMHVRDRLSNGHSGYRDITLIVSFVNSVAMHNNVLGHVCEVRLSLISLHSIIVLGKHTQYLRRKMVLRKTNKVKRGSRRTLLLVNLHWKQFLRTFSFAVHPAAIERCAVNQSSLLASFSPTSSSSPPSPLSPPSPPSLSPPPPPLCPVLNLKSILPGGFLDHMVKSADAGVHDSKTASVIFSSRPLTNVIHKPLFQLCLVFIGFMLVVNYAIDDYYPVREMRTRTLFSVAHARVTIIRQRDPSLADPSVVPIQKVSFLRDCKKFSPSFVGRNGSQQFYSFSRPVSAHGWEFYTNPDVSSYYSDPLAFDLHVLGEDEGVNDPIRANETQWELRTRFDCSMNRATALCHSEEANISRTRDVRYFVDLRMAWQCAFELVNIGLRFLACFGTAIFVNMGRTYWGKTVCACAFFGPGIFDLLNLMFTPFTVLEFLHSLSWVVIELGYGLVMQFKEEYALTCLPIFALSGSFFNTLFTDLRAREVIIDSSTIRLNHVVLFSVWLFLWLWRKHLLYKSYKKVEKDLVEYEELWKKVAEDEETVSALRVKFAKIAHNHQSSSALQHVFLCPGPALKRFLLWMERTLHVQVEDEWQHEQGSSSRLGSLTDIMRHLNPLSSHLRISSLEQLYAQALMVQPIFFKKLQEIGSQCNCLFPVSDRSRRAERYITWASAYEGGGGVLAVKPPILKNVNRAIQKVIRSYNGDVSRLVDIVRYALVFEDIRELSRAIDIILEDPHIEIMRVKNRLVQSYNALASVGYRDICLNIRISNDDTKRFCVAGYRCELQLVLKSFMDLRVEKGHKNYRIFRDQRCE